MTPKVPQRRQRQLTLRGLGPELEEVLQREASEEGISLNQAAVRLLKRGAGISEKRLWRDVIGGALDRYIGVWSEQDADRFAEATRDLERIDPELWK
jgi:hypothetical protein